MLYGLAKKINIPIVMTRDEVREVINVMEGVPQLIVKFLYGCGLRIMETVRLRVQDVDYKMKTVIVRSGKGAKDRITTFPETITPLLQNHLAKVHIIHNQDLSQGFGEVYLPHALPCKEVSQCKQRMELAIRFFLQKSFKGSNDR